MSKFSVNPSGVYPTLDYSFKALVFRLEENFRDFSPQHQQHIQVSYHALYEHYGSNHEEALKRFLAALQARPEINAVTYDILEVMVRASSAEQSLPEDLLEGFPREFGARGVLEMGAKKSQKPRETKAKNGEDKADKTETKRKAVLKRYPDLNCSDTVAIQETMTLTVMLKINPPRKSSKAIRIPDESKTPPKLEVVLRAHGFELPEGDSQLLNVQRNEDSQLRFKLIPKEEGTKTLQVDFYCRGRYLGSSTCQTKVVQSLGNTPPGTATTKTFPLTVPAASVYAPDLNLRIYTNDGDDERLFFELHSEREEINYHFAKVGSISLRWLTQEKIESIYKTLSGFAGRGRDLGTEGDEQEKKKVSKKIDEIGMNLWRELVPKELKEAYWEFKDKVTTLQITSDEPWIPWEIIKPFRMEKKKNEPIAEKFWCEKFVLARWLAGGGPEDTLELSRVQPAIPKTDLEAPQRELELLEQLPQFAPGLKIMKPCRQKEQIMKALQKKKISILHVATHGNFQDDMPNDSAIQLDGDPLTPSDIYELELIPRPLIFLNACHGARQEYSLAERGGWPERFLDEARVAAFVGAAWKVSDGLAFKFMEAFYMALLKEKLSLGESMRKAREAICDEADSSWLAYVLYADPQALAKVMS